MGLLLYTLAQHGHKYIANLEQNDIEHRIGRERKETCFSPLKRRKIDRSHCACYRLSQQLTMFGYRRPVFNAVDQ